jgi:hypothetical protein
MCIGNLWSALLEVDKLQIDPLLYRLLSALVTFPETAFTVFRDYPVNTVIPVMRERSRYAKAATASFKTHSRLWVKMYVCRALTPQNLTSIQMFTRCLLKW